MPCQDYQTPEEIAERNTDKSVLYYRERLDLVTRLLCEICTEWKKDCPLPSIELDRWYKDHKSRDSMRLEEIRKKAMWKLTEEEKEVLGLI